MSDDAVQDNRTSRDEPAGLLESDWIARLVRQTSRSAQPVPLGDDAAVMGRSADREWVFAQDLLAEGTHFELHDDAPLARIGQKSVGVNLSDLAAMGAEASGCLVAVAIPASWKLPHLQELYDGVLSICNRFDVELLGGDTNVWSGGLVISATAIGHVAPGTAWRRGGGRPGDLLAVTGPLGGSRLAKQWCAEPRLREARRIRQVAQVDAAIDISDGLSLDLWRLATASRCGATLRAEDIPVSPDAIACAGRGSGKSPLEHALTDGEDFELLLALPPDSVRRLQQDERIGGRLHIIGRLEQDPGLWLETADGRQRLAPRGYLHGT